MTELTTEYIQDLRNILEIYTTTVTQSILKGEKLWFNMYTGSDKFGTYRKLREAGVITESPASDSRNKFWNIDEDYRDVMIMYFDML